MKLQLTHSGSDPHFTGYGEGYVAVGGERYEHHLVVTPGHAVTRWEVSGFEALTVADFQALLETKPEVVVFGTGDTLRFPAREIMALLSQAGVGFEVMDTRAACRTYNILLAEDRKVLAAILLA
ncbi:MAG: Mth938-like domain-containing protein [Rhodospirillaceae bacterium]